MVGEKNKLKLFKDRKISGKNYFGEQLINNFTFTREILWDLNYKHLHILFTSQVALFLVVWAVGVGDFFYCRVREN